ncbi:hypothetical protein H4R19_000599 [Coemansia spiralis]|nr:hypothetical protein H4R19_000599 [Coemansia spiralis]
MSITPLLSQMLSELAAFLAGEARRCLRRCGSAAVDRFSSALADVERCLAASAGPEDCARAVRRASAPFEHALGLVCGRTAAENDAEPWWAPMLVDAALLQALAHIALGHDGELTLKALNDLDRAIIIGGASGARLRWIHAVTDHIEGASQWLRCSAADEKARRLQAQPPLPVIGLPAPPAVAHPVRRYSVDEVDVVRFLELVRDVDAATPFVIEGAISFWPALGVRGWRDLEYLREAVGSHRLVSVELGDAYTDSGWTQTLIPFGQLLDTIASPHTTSAPRGYLAQHDLFAQAPRLRCDIVVPDYALVDTGRRPAIADADDIAVKVWLGPRGTVSPLHWDPTDNLFAQVVGHKYFKLYAPSETSNLYPHPPGSLLANTSQVDAAAPDPAQHPRAADACYVETIVWPGDLLYIPPRWWHYVRSLSTSASVSIWF